MKLLKSKLMNKVIIILIAIIIFNIAIPQEVKAFDLAGILIKPLTQLILTVLVTIDTTIGIAFNGGAIPGNTVSGVTKSVGAITEWAIGSTADVLTGEWDNFKSRADKLKDGQNDAADDINESLGQLFIGPDTIFSGKVYIFNANIFSNVNITQLNEIIRLYTDEEGTAWDSVKNHMDTLVDASAPRIPNYNKNEKRYSKYIYNNKRHCGLYNASRTCFYWNKNTT